MHCSAVLLLCVVVLVCSVNAQKKCCTADQYEAQGLHTTYTEKGWIHRELDIAIVYFPKLSIDHTNKKYAMQEVFEKNISFTTILDANEKIAYIFSVERKYCRKIRLDKSHPMKNHCIPEDAKYMGSAHIGPEQGGLYSDSFALATKDGSYKVIDVIREQCIMSYMNTQGKAKGRKFAATLAFTDYTAGIKDPSVCKVPSFCQETEVEMEGETVDKVKTMVAMFSGFI